MCQSKTVIDACRTYAKKPKRLIVYNTTHLSQYVYVEICNSAMHFPHGTVITLPIHVLLTFRH